MAQFRNVADQAKQFWTTRTGSQKLMLLGGAAATIVLVAVFARLLSSPDYKPLFTDMEPADAQKLATQLDAQNIPHQVSADGKTLSVPADKLAEARLHSASQGEPHSGRMGFELFDKMSWGQTEFDQKVAYQRAMEGELERTIQTLSDVERARVHLVMPTDSVFLDRQRSGKASVILKLKRGSLSKDAVTAISRLVSGAVDELKPEDVVIIDADSNRSLGMGRNGPESGEAEEARLTDRLISTLEPVVGANSIRASVNILYDEGSTEKSSEEYDPTVSAVLSSQKTEDSAAGGSVAAGVPGTASNVPPADKSKTVSTVNPQSPNQSSRSENVQYGVDRTVTHTVMPAGGIKRVTAAILVDDAVVKTVKAGKTTYSRQPRTQEEITKVRELAQAVVGFDASRGDVITVQQMPFSSASDSDLPATNWAAQVQTTVANYSSLFRPLSILLLFVLIYLFILRPVQKHVLTQALLPAGSQAALATANVQSLPEGLDENARAAYLKQHALDLVRQKPADAARALRLWVREEE